MRKRIFDWLMNLGLEKALEEATKEQIDVKVEFCTCCEVQSLFYEEKCIRCDKEHVVTDIWIGASVAPVKTKGLKSKKEAADVVVRVYDETPSEVTVEIYRGDLR